MSGFDDLLQSAPRAPGPGSTPFRRSIIEQESGGKGYGAVGEVYTHKNTGLPARMDLGEIALGKHQIVPKFWFDKIGLDPKSADDRQKFLNSPDLQDRALDFVIADGENRYPGDLTKQSAAYYGGSGGAAVVGTAAGDKPQSAGMPSVNSYAKSVNSRIPDSEASNFDDFLAGAPKVAADAPDNTEFELPAAPPSDGFMSFLAGAPRERMPSLDMAQQPGRIDINQPQPVANGLPALQPAQTVAGPVEPPSAPVPFTSVPPSLTGFQPPQKPTPQQNLQAAGDRMPISSEEIGSAFTKGALGGAIPGANIPMTERETRSGGQYLGTAAGGLLPALAGPLAIPAMMASSGLGAAARGMTPQGEVQNPMEVGIQAALGGILAKLPPALGKNIVAQASSGGAIGAVQGAVQEAFNKAMKNGTLRPEDAQDPEAWKQIASSAIMGMMFGAHGHFSGKAIAEAQRNPTLVPEIRHASDAMPVTPPEQGKIQHPSEMTSEIPQQPGFADRAQQEALQDTQTKFTTYDPEGRREPPINVSQDGVPTTPQGDPNMQRDAFLKQAEQYLGPEKANAFKVLMGEYLPGGKNASPYGVRLQKVPEVQAPMSANASDLNSKNSSSSMRNASNDNLANGGEATPGMPVEMANDPSLRNTTWTGKRPILQNEDRAALKTSEEIQEPGGIPENVPPAPEEVKPTPFELKRLDKPPEKLPTLREAVRKAISKGAKIYLDDEARAQLGMSETKAREYGPIFTKDKQAGISFDRIAEGIREEAIHNSQFYAGFGDGRNVQATDVIDALFAGNQEYSKPRSDEPEHVSATNDFLRNGNADFEGATPTPARALKNEFEAGGMKFKRIKAADKARIAYKDEYGGKYDFHPDETVHTGGQVKARPPEEQAPATTPQEEFDGTLFQKGPPKTSQEDMFGNKGRVASEGLIKGKGEDKGLEGTPLFEGEKRADQAKAEEDQQRLFQTAETAGLPETRADDPKALEQAARLWKEKGVDSPHFRKWFGSSKVVDESGNPKAVYHGTNKPGFEHFDTYSSNYGLFGQGGYFTEDPRIASSYAFKKLSDPSDRGPGVLKSYVKIDHPIDMDGPADLAKWREAYPDAEFTETKKFSDLGDAFSEPMTNEQAYRQMEEAIRDEGHTKWEGAEIAQDALRSMGYDGITHIGGARHAASDGTKHRVWIAFNPEQIKSATGNRGTFEAKSESMLHQGKAEQEIKGYTDFDPAKKEFTISLVDGKADISTLFHEFFHTLEQGGVVSKADRAILTKALEAHGIHDAVNAKGVYTEAGAEKVADWWERYLRDGKSPVKELQGIFDKVRNWMVEVYRSIKGTRLEGQVPKSVRAVFDRIIEGGRQAEGAHPEEGRLAQKSGKPSKPTEQLVGPDAPKNQKTATREDFMVMEAKAGEKESGYLSNPEKLLFGAADRAYPIKKIQKMYEKEFGFPVDSDSDLKYAINRIYGAAGSADQYIDRNLAPAIEGGTIAGRQFERLMPAESKSLFEYLLARDALWRYDNTDGYEMPNNLSKKMAQDIVQEHKDLAAKSPEQYAKLEKAADAMIEYARGLAIKKLEIGLWSPEEFEAITKNPHYVPEIRYWAKTLATGKTGGQGLDFATKSKLVRGTKASGENVPVFDPLTSLIHDTHQLAKEGAKHYLGNAIIDMQESSPELQKIITEQEDDYKPKAHEGTFPVRRPRTTHLSPEQEKFAERYQNAVWQLKAEEESTGTTKEDQILEHNRRKIAERVAALPPNKRNLFGKDMLDIVNKVEESRKAWQAKRLKEAQETEAEFRALPADQQKIIKRWMKEGQVTNYTVPIELAQAMNAMEPIQYGTIGKLLKGTTTLFKKGTVTWNPGFAMINAVRDVQEAYINTGMRPDYAVRGWLDFIKESPLYHTYLERGGAIGNSESGFKGSTTRSSDLRYGRRMVKDRFNKVKDPEAWKNKTIKIGDKEYNYGKLARAGEALLQGIKLPVELMEAFGHMSEMSTRLGAMRYAKEKLGMNDDQAVDLARHATLDFDQRGGSLNVQRAMDVVPFLNPRIQGTLRTGKRLTDGLPAVKTITIGGLVPMLGITAANMLNPNYANVSDRDKRYSWIIMIPGTDKHMAIPKPAIVQALLNPFQMALEKAAGTSPTSYRQQAIESMQEILPVTDPSSVLPPLAKAVLENKVNKDMFWNRPVVKEPGREPLDQYDPRTSQTMKSVAKKLQWLPNEVEWLKSPERLQHISKTMLGGTADNLLFLTDMLLGDAKKTLRSEYVPVVSRFYKGAEEWQGELANKQRELISAIKLKERSAGSGTEAMQTARKGEKLDSEATGARIHRTADAMKDTFRELGELNKEIERVGDLIQAVKEKNPGVEYHFLRPPTLKKRAIPAPSDATPEASPAPENATSPSTSETESEEAP